MGLLQVNIGRAKVLTTNLIGVINHSHLVVCRNITLIK